MAASLETLHKDMEQLQKDMAFIKRILAEDYELSDYAKKELTKARKAPKSEYVSQEDIEKEFLS